MKRRGTTRKISSSQLDGLLNDSRFRIALLGAVFAVGMLVLWARLYYMQVMGGEKHLEQVSNQSLRRIRIPNLRGKILSSDREILADNKLEFDLVFYPQEMKRSLRRDTVLAMYNNAIKAAKMVGVERSFTTKEILNHLYRRPGIPFTVLRNLDTASAARAFEFARMTPGCDVGPRMVRVYPQGRTACHLIGFTGLEERQNASDKEEFFYYIPDTVGREGVEKACDVLPDKPGAGLRGYPGYSLIQVDKMGYAKNHIIHEIPPVPGANVILTLDMKAQRTAERVLAGHRGAIVVLDASNGDVLAAASAPGYDLSKFSPSVPRKYYSSLRNDPDNPLINRAFYGVYTPGSIFKPIALLALLSEGVNAENVIDCDGASHIGDARIRCASYRRGGHGTVNSVDAINWSCNDYMIENAVKFPADTLFEAASRAGIGRRSGIEIADARGVAPSFAEKRRRYRFGWTKYDTALLSIGQGIISITPLQAAVFCAALANGGKVYKPHLVKEIVDNTGLALHKRKVEEISTLKSTPEAFEVVKRGMFEAVNSSSGSGRRARVDGLEMYGKTGSAEIGRRGNLKIIAWFIAYTQYKGRTYAVAAMVEEGTSGGSLCAPMVKRFFENYLSPQENEQHGS
ncbi:MAG: hypothetical protein IJC21_00855 [Lentisphaeria bacterium]|nr:hypothetical protein [Lentisphaeria bacterium]